MARRIFLFDWDEASARSRAQALSAAGFDVRVESRDGARGYREIQRDRPDAVVFDLDRRPSHARETARALHDVGRTRDLPLIFVGGDAEAREKVGAVVANATFTRSEDLVPVLQRLLPDR